VLVEGDPASDPIAEEVKSILDGHLILSSKLAEAGHYPAIDVLASGSRVMDQVVGRKQRDAAVHLRRLLARHQEIELLVRIGEYQAGSDPLADEALRKIEPIRDFLREAGNQATPFAATLQRLAELAA
jgi:type III secretion protein N (ATPase)